MKIQNVKISDIDPQNKFVYHIDLLPSDLYRSVQMFGVKMPIWLIKSDILLIVDGYRRFHIGQNLKLRELPAIIFEGNEFNRLFLAALSVNSSNQKLSAIERLRVFQLCQKYLNNSLFEEILDILDLNFITLEKDLIQFIDNLPPWLEKYFHKIDLSVKHIKKLILFSFPEYELWFKMAQILNFKGNELLNLLEMIHEICLRDDMSADKCWRLLSIDSLTAEYMNRPQISSRIKKKVFDLRYPVLRNLNKEIRDKVYLLTKSSKGFLHVDWDDSLEEGTLQLGFSINRAEDLEKLVSFAENTKNRHVINEILNDMNFLSADKKDDHPQ